MQQCDNGKCKRLHDGSFGSGRFCSRACANSRVFSDECNRKKSLAMKNLIANGYEVPRGYLTDKARQKSILVRRENRKNLPFEKLGWPAKRKIVIKEQKHTCAKCNNDVWLGHPIPLEIDHKDGNRKNEIRDNLEAVCPTCHALTPTYKHKNGVKKTSRQKKRYSDEDMIEAILTSKNLNACLDKLDLSYGSASTIVGIMVKYLVNFLPS